MKCKINIYSLLLIIVVSLFSCEEDEPVKKESDTDSSFFSKYTERTFSMGFSTWAYAQTIEAVDNTYDFISQHSDIYSEHIDYSIPWSAWMNDLPLPQEFTNEIASRKQRKINGVKLAVSVSLLNTARNDLAFDFDGSVLSYSNFNDRHIEEAYFKHLEYIATELKPEYLLLAIEVNELLKNAPEKWEGYKKLLANIRPRIKQRFPDIVISESITLHNLYKPDVSNQDAFIEEVVDYANGLDLVTISFYPYFKGLRYKEEFQDAFDYLHEKISKPIAFSETSHLSEDLLVPSMLVDIKGNEDEQDDYLETLLINAQEKDYEYIIWWCHRDYNELWEVFPDEVKDIGKLWISTGIVNEDGRNKKAIETWKSVLAY